MIPFAATVMTACLAAPPKLTFEGAKRHPTVNYSPEEVARARKRIENDPVAKEWFADLKKSVKRWADKDQAWVKSVMPEEGACFAYGFTGCPICSAKWGTWGGARCSFDKPGKVTCRNGHVLPNEEYPDPGTGYKAEDGRIHYFVGSYNAWVVETLIFKVAKPQAKLYLLTGDARAGRMAVVILDEIARIYPSCDKGSWDYPSNPPSGRLNRPWYQVARVLVHFVDMYDWVYDHPALDEPSSREGLTRRKNIEKNLLLNGAEYCYDMSIKQGGLHNGEADYLRGVLAVGIVLGIPEYVTWPVDGTYGIRTMLANNVDRDGRYFETAVGYALHTRNLYLTFSEPLHHYRGSAYPDGLNLYDDPRFQSFYVLPQMATTCLGHRGTFGDAAPAFRTKTKTPYYPDRIWDVRYTQRLATRVSDPKKRSAYGALLLELRRRDPDADRKIGDVVEWRVFHAPEDEATPGPLPARMTQYLDGSFFVGQKGLAVLRQGEGKGAHAAILRFGPSLVHGHYDDLNVNYYAAGYDISYDLGYSLGSTHTQVGWAKQTVSHNCVVVDETSHGGGQYGGSLLHYADLAGLKVVEASSNVYAYKGVDVYRRLFALAGEYALDVFRVRGGTQHDLPMHSFSTEVEFANVRFSEPQKGSLAGETYAWGAMQLNDGDMEGYPGKPYWNPPPGNGYGFLVEPAWARPAGNWSATWKIDDKAATRLCIHALHNADAKVVTAVAPGLYPTYPKARYAIRRRKGEDFSSCFVTVWDAFDGGDGGKVVSVRRLDGNGALRADSSIVLCVELADGHRDIWCLGGEARSEVRAKLDAREIAFRGAIGRARLKGAKLVSAEMLDARRMAIGDWDLALDAPSRSAKVATLPDGLAAVTLDQKWPSDGRYVGNPVTFHGGGYSRNTAYTIKKIAGKRLTTGQAGTILGQGTVTVVKDAHTLLTKVPHEYARPVTRKRPSGFFQRKLLRSVDGKAETHIRRIRFGSQGTMAMEVDSTEGFAPGQRFRYHDIEAGDTATVHHFLSITRVGERGYAVRANEASRVRCPGETSSRRLHATGAKAKTLNF